jgi:hypothetical protein
LVEICRVSFERREGASCSIVINAETRVVDDDQPVAPGVVGVIVHRSA